MRAYLHQTDNLKLAVGDALLRWAMVELHIYMMFHNQSGIEPKTADSIWGTIVSLDARITMVQRIFTAKHPEGPIHDDLILLLNEVRKRYRQRNEIAHATLVYEDGITPQLEPFLLYSGDRPRLGVAELEERSREFSRLFEALSWLLVEMGPSASPTTQQTASQPPPPDLVLELRAEESRRRKEQSGRQKLLGHALKLAAAGQLPDWPPDQDLGSVVQSASS